MKILIDTPIWSLALRRKNDLNREIVHELKELISEFRVIIIGPIRQEVLSGIPDLKIFLNVKEKLGSFEDTTLTTHHYEYAAELYNICRKKGIQGSHIDFLMCAVSILNSCSIFTTDKDFKNYKKYLDIKLYNPEKNRI